MIIDPYSLYTRSVYSIVQALGIDSGLQFCLDAGDIRSVGSTASNTWIDLTSNGQTFFRGNTNAVEASDPTYNGTPGSLSLDEYYSVDGADAFTYDATNETWMTNLHKDNAQFSGAVWIYPGNLGGVSKALMGTRGATGSTTGAAWQVSAGNTMQWTCHSSGTQVILASAPGPALGHDVVIGQWQFLGFTINEATGTSGIMWQTNGNTSFSTSTYSSPSAAAASATFQIGARGALNIPWPSGTRFGICAAWNRQISQTDMMTFYQATRARYGV